MPCYTEKQLTSVQQYTEKQNTQLLGNCNAAKHRKGHGKLGKLGLQWFFFVIKIIFYEHDYFGNYYRFLLL